MNNQEAITEAETAYWEAVNRYKKTGRNMQEVWDAFDKWNLATLNLQSRVQELMGKEGEK